VLVYVSREFAVVLSIAYFHPKGSNELPVVLDEEFSLNGSNSSAALETGRIDALFLRLLEPATEVSVTGCWRKGPNCAEELLERAGESKLTNFSIISSMENSEGFVVSCLAASALIETGLGCGCCGCGC
jgi:hypothetical protein